MVTPMDGVRDMTDFTELTSLHPKSYGGWAGYPKGHRPDPARCAQEVPDSRGLLWYQCSRKRGHGPEQAYCKQHDPAAVKAKREAQAAKWRAEWEAEAKAREAERAALQLGKDAIAALQQIADGHNDPRGLAQGVLSGERKP